jgi:hypothetical protein
MTTEIDNTIEIAEIKNASSKILAGFVVVYRTLGIFKERSILCMQELMARRNAGDDFNFEEYIENEVANMPKPTDLGGLSKILGKGIL